MTALPFHASLGPQGAACQALGSPFMARLMALMAARDWPATALTRRLFDWPGDTGGTGAAVALRLAGALHALVLDRAEPALAAAYPPHEVDDDTLWAAVTGAMERHADRIDAVLDQPPQTNEVRRSAALIAGAHWIDARVGLPLVLSEFGASAGLNLHWDRYALDLPGGEARGSSDPVLRLAPKWTGELPPDAAPKVAERRGVDLRPVDPADPAHRLRLLSYLWPDQPERLARTLAALDLPPAPVDAGDLVPWLADRLARPWPGRLHLVTHTITWSYLPPATQAAVETLLDKAGAAATPEAPLARLSLEPDGATPGAAIRATLWPGGVGTSLGRAGFHGEWLHWQPVEEGAPE